MSAEQSNEELRESLKQLQEMQTQLFVKEKLVSLGQLVAGISHELNNPLGAINSTANVLNRGVRKIASILENDDVVEISENKIQIQKISKLLLENLNVISVGVNRITQIVESAQKLS